MPLKQSDLDFDFSLVDNEAADDWIRARRLKIEGEKEPRAKRDLKRMEETELVKGK